MDWIDRLAQDLGIGETIKYYQYEPETQDGQQFDVQTRRIYFRSCLLSVEVEEFITRKLSLQSTMKVKAGIIDAINATGETE
jgi:hypothetical protein